MNYRGQQGFTLLEVLLVCTLVATISALALIVSMDSYKGSSFRAERNLLIAVLERARAQSMHNICLGDSCTDGMPHGVELLPNQIILFQGKDYDHRDSAVDAIFSISTIETGGAHEIVFSQLSGTTSGATIFLFDTGGHSSTTTVSTDGEIVWTH